MTQLSIFSVCAGIAISSAILTAQTPLQGTVQDPQGERVDAAELVLYRAGGAAPLARTRSDKGTFTFPSISVGS